MTRIYELDEVFVPVGFPEHTYVNRTDLELKTKSAKINKRKHVNIFGPSKSGKSNLWRNHFDNKNIIKIGINRDSTINDIYSEILNKLEAFYSSEKSKNRENSGSISAEIKAKLAILEGKLKSQINSKRLEGEKQIRVVAPLISANTVIGFLAQSDSYVVIEEFHYANDDLIAVIAEDLKNFSDEGCPFILISVDHMTPVLYKANDKELQGRVLDIPVGLFSRDQLKEIITKGCEKLNVEFSSEIVEKIINEAKKSAAITQDICQKICLLEDIMRTSKPKKYITDTVVFEKACQFIASEQKSVYEKVINAVKKHSHGNNKTEVYKWIMLYIQKNDIPDYGVVHNEVHKKLKDMGHSTILLPSVTNALNYLPKLMQREKLDSYFEFNENNTFFLHDMYLQFVFKWSPDLVLSLFDN